MITDLYLALNINIDGNDKQSATF